MVRRLQCVEIIWPFTQHQSCGSKLIETFLVAQSDTPPVVALQKYDRPVEVKARDRDQFAAALPELAKKPHPAAAFGLRITTISQPPSEIDAYFRTAHSTMPPTKGSCESFEISRVDRAAKPASARLFKNCSRCRSKISKSGPSVANNRRSRAFVV